MIEKIIQKSLQDEELSEKEIKELFNVTAFSREEPFLFGGTKKIKSN